MNVNKSILVNFMAYGFMVWRKVFQAIYPIISILVQLVGIIGVITKLTDPVMIMAICGKRLDCSYQINITNHPLHLHKTKVNAMFLGFFKMETNKMTTKVL